MAQEWEYRMIVEEWRLARHDDDWEDGLFFFVVERNVTPWSRYRLSREWINLLDEAAETRPHAGGAMVRWDGIDNDPWWFIQLRRRRVRRGWRNRIWGRRR